MGASKYAFSKKKSFPLYELVKSTSVLFTYRLIKSHPIFKRNGSIFHDILFSLDEANHCSKGKVGIAETKDSSGVGPCH